MHTLGAYRHAELREAMRATCAEFGSEYWRKVDDERAFPEDFVNSLTLGGWLAALIPHEYGGGGLGITEASVIMEEINRSGGNAQCCHGHVYATATLVRHASETHKQRWLPRLASGELRLQCMAVAEGESGGDVTAIATTAVKSRSADRYVLNGRKAWIARVGVSDGVLLLARTTPLSEVATKTEGLSLFMVALHEAIGQGLTVRPMHNNANLEMSEFLIEELEMPADRLIGEEGKAFTYIMDVLNAQHVLSAAECIGDAHWFLEAAQRYANERVVFGRAIGQNQGIQFPLAQAYMETEAADLMRFKACDLFDTQQRCGVEATMAKYLAAKASWEAADVCMQTHGGYGFASEYDIGRKFMQTRLHQVAPLSTNLVLAYIAERGLGLPRSF